MAALLQLAVYSNAQFSLSGKVLNHKDSLPVIGASVTISETDLWATTNNRGDFFINNLPAGKTAVRISSLNYVTELYQINLIKDIVDTVFFLKENNLTLEDVEVTATVTKSISNSFTINRTALDHLQMINATDAMQLLPGGKTNRNLNLTSSLQPNSFAVNGTNGEDGNALFGVGVEVDGVRLSPNALPGTNPVDVRNIASSNIESIEVVTGIPSVEYGDMTNGLVKINTRKGATPFILDMVTKPNTKQIALSKGINLKKQGGIVNMSLEHTKSISNIASPYTSYDRNSLSLNYSNTFFNRFKKQPLQLNIGVAGNMGGADTKSDPDKFVNTYSRSKDNVVRANASIKWLLQKKWITNLEANTSVNYNNQFSENSDNKSASASVAAIHAMQTGYFVGQTYEQNPNAEILLVAPGYWYETRYSDSKALNYAASVKANWSKKSGFLFNNMLIGGEYSGSKNTGAGVYYADIRYAPTWRPYKYNQEPVLNNYGLYVEDKLRINLGLSSLQITAGVRSDFTNVKSSEYGTVSSLSPRVNTKYIFWQNKKDQIVSSLSISGGWGKSVKLPSFNILYRVPQYRDIISFAPGTTSSGETFYAYYSSPYARIFNPDLQWQYNLQTEIGITATISGTDITIIASDLITKRPYDGLKFLNPLPISSPISPM